MRTLPVYIDFKSPYAYLAVQPSRAMALEYGLRIHWRPYNLPIAGYLGSVETRNEHQWRRVKYSYMDVRRLANQRGLTIRGPRKLYDSTVASIGLLYAQRAGTPAAVPEAYIDTVFRRFFERNLDLEDPQAIAAVLRQCGADAGDFQTFLATDGAQALVALVDAAHRAGVFGVPSYLLDDELFWGNERMALLTERLRARQLAAATANGA